LRLGVKAIGTEVLATVIRAHGNVNIVDAAPIALDEKLPAAVDGNADRDSIAIDGDRAPV